jgi:hypothetical protein
MKITSKTMGILLISLAVSAMFFVINAEHVGASATYTDVAYVISGASFLVFAGLVIGWMAGKITVVNKK